MKLCGAGCTRLRSTRRLLGRAWVGRARRARRGVRSAANRRTIRSPSYRSNLRSSPSTRAGPRHGCDARTARTCRPTRGRSARSSGRVRAGAAAWPCRVRRRAICATGVTRSPCSSRWLASSTARWRNSGGCAGGIWTSSPSRPRRLRVDVRQNRGTSSTRNRRFSARQPSSSCSSVAADPDLGDPSGQAGPLLACHSVVRPEYDLARRCDAVEVGVVLADRNQPVWDAPVAGSVQHYAKCRVTCANVDRFNRSVHDIARFKKVAAKVRVKGKACSTLFFAHLRLSRERARTRDRLIEPPQLTECFIQRHRSDRTLRQQVLAPCLADARKPALLEHS